MPEQVTIHVHRPSRRIYARVHAGLTQYTDYLRYNDERFKTCTRVSYTFLAVIVASTIVYVAYTTLGRHNGPGAEIGATPRPLIYDTIAFTKQAGDSATFGEVSPPLSKNILQIMNITELYDYYRGLITLLTYDCRNSLVYGTNPTHIAPGTKPHQVEWMICQDPRVKLRRGECIVYSFGLNWDFTYEEDLASRSVCEVFAYDPSQGISSMDRKGQSYYFPIALDGTKKDAGSTWRTKSMEEILDMNKHSHADIDVLKLDLDGNEWDVLDKLINKEKVFRRVRQLALGVNLMKDQMSPQQLRNRIEILEDLTELGMRLYSSKDIGSGTYYNIYVHRNMTCCSTLHFVNLGHRNFHNKDYDHTGDEEEEEDENIEEDDA